MFFDDVLMYLSTAIFCASAYINFPSIKYIPLSTENIIASLNGSVVCILAEKATVELVVIVSEAVNGPPDVILTNRVIGSVPVAATANLTTAFVPDVAPVIIVSVNLV